jgi:hypothetical protein
VAEAACVCPAWNTSVIKTNCVCSTCIPHSPTLSYVVSKEAIDPDDDIGWYRRDYGICGLSRCGKIRIIDNDATATRIFFKPLDHIHNTDPITISAADPEFFRKLATFKQEIMNCKDPKEPNPKCTTCGCDPCVCGLTTW